MWIRGYTEKGFVLNELVVTKCSIRPPHYTASSVLLCILYFVASATQRITLFHITSFHQLPITVWCADNEDVFRQCFSLLLQAFIPSFPLSFYCCFCGSMSRFHNYRFNLNHYYSTFVGDNYSVASVALVSSLRFFAYKVLSKLRH